MFADHLEDEELLEDVCEGVVDQVELVVDALERVEAEARDDLLVVFRLQLLLGLRSLLVFVVGHQVVSDLADQVLGLEQRGDHLSVDLVATVALQQVLGHDDRLGAKSVELWVLADELRGDQLDAFCVLAEQLFDAVREVGLQHFVLVVRGRPDDALEDEVHDDVCDLDAALVHVLEQRGEDAHGEDDQTHVEGLLSAFRDERHAHEFSAPVVAFHEVDEQLEDVDDEVSAAFELLDLHVDVDPLEHQLVVLAADVLVSDGYLVEFVERELLDDVRDGVDGGHDEALEGEEEVVGVFGAGEVVQHVLLAVLVRAVDELVHQLQTQVEHLDVFVLRDDAAQDLDDREVHETLLLRGVEVWVQLCRPLLGQLEDLDDDAEAWSRAATSLGVFHGVVAEALKVLRHALAEGRDVEFDALHCLLPLLLAFLEFVGLGVLGLEDEFDERAEFGLDVLQVVAAGLVAVDQFLEDLVGGRRLGLAVFVAAADDLLVHHVEERRLHLVADLFEVVLDGFGLVVVDQDGEQLVDLELDAVGEASAGEDEGAGERAEEVCEVGSAEAAVAFADEVDGDELLAAVDEEQQVLFVERVDLDAVLVRDDGVAGELFWSCAVFALDVFEVSDEFLVSRSYDEDVDQLAEVCVLQRDGLGEVGVADVVQDGELDGDGQADDEPAHDVAGEQGLLERDGFLRDVEHVAVVAFVAAVQQVDDREREFELDWQRDDPRAFVGEEVGVEFVGELYEERLEADLLQLLRERVVACVRKDYRLR